MKKTAIFSFTGSLPCFSHALLNVLDMNERGEEAVLVMEGASVELIPGLLDESKAFSPLFKKLVEAGQLSAVCRACAAKLGTLDAAEAAELPVRGEMSGHPSMKDYRDEGYEIITI